MNEFDECFKRLARHPRQAWQARLAVDDVPTSMGKTAAVVPA